MDKSKITISDKLEVSGKEIRDIIFSDELNQRITSAIDDEDFPNSGSVTASLVQEEICIQFQKEGVLPKNKK